MADWRWWYALGVAVTSFLLSLVLFKWPSLALHAAAPIEPAPGAIHRPFPFEHAPFQRYAASPYPSPGRALVRVVAFAPTAGRPVRPLLTTLTATDKQPLPALSIVAPSADQLPHLSLRPSQRRYHGPLPIRPLPNPAAPPVQAAFPGQSPLHPPLIDGWRQLAALPPGGNPATHVCRTASNAPHAWRGPQDAPTGHGATPSAPRDSWLVCGPFDLDADDTLWAHYTYRLALAGLPGASFFFGVSNDGKTFHGMTAAGFAGDRLAQRVQISQPGVTRLWVAWLFEHQDNLSPGAGVWLDEFQVWRRRQPPARCGALDAGDKGVILAPYDPTTPIPAPMIRAGDTVAVERLAAAGVHWVRMGFQAQRGGVDLHAYDRMIDTLCAHGISVLGLLNHETLLRHDYDRADEATIASYRAEFASLAEFLARHYAGRIAHWEVWNEPNLAEGAYLPPERYAHLLQAAHQGIKRANPQARVLFGGLASAWADSHDYLAAVYAELDAHLYGARPFDHLALHPYPRRREGPDPTVYMFADRAPGHVTIVDKFLETMAAHGDHDKSIWVTEVGWNSAGQSRNRPGCYNPVLVQEAEQARYLTAMFDILFNDVPFWGQPGTRAVEKVFWYQYMDVGALDPCPPARTTAPPAARDWWFGLYQGDKVTPKLGWCAFVAWPQPCADLGAID